MRSLFWRILASFWLAIALVAGLSILLGHLDVDIVVGELAFQGAGGVAGTCPGLAWPGAWVGRLVGWVVRVGLQVSQRETTLWSLAPYSTVPERSGEGGNSGTDDWSIRNREIIYGFSLATIKPPCMPSVHTEVQQ